jgi:hypothetical protein
MNSDGDIAMFKKGGSTIGSIGVDSGDNLTVSGSVADHGGLYMGTNTVIPMSGGVSSSGTVSLGNNGTLWKDLYLSGGVYLGGTDADHKLDDVETGTWTPALSRTGSNYSYNGYQYGTYEKIGNLVVASFTLNLQSISAQGSGYNQLTGLPFTPSAYNANLQFVGSLGTRTVLSAARDFYWAGAIFFLNDNSSALGVDYVTGFMSGFITYKTAA